MNNKLTYTKTEEKHLKDMSKILRKIHLVHEALLENCSIMKYSKKGYKETLEYINKTYWAMDDIMCVLEGAAEDRLDRKLTKQRDMLERLDNDDE